LQAIADLETGSPETLHEETGITVSTIHYRLNNLREAGVVDNDLYDVDLAELGLDVTVFAEVLVDYDGNSEAVGEKLAAVEGVTGTYFTMGETDILVVPRLSGREMVERLMGDFEAIPEVRRTNSTFVIATVDEDERALASYELETLLTELVEE
jgi:DNA-binding Lrp family transcriptional regulator